MSDSTSEIGSRMRADLVPGEWEVLSCDVWPGRRLWRCQACNKANVRYTHNVRHKETGLWIKVGISCCGVLIGDPGLAQRLENEVRRKLGWREYYGTKTWRPCSVTYPLRIDLEGEFMDSISAAMLTREETDNRLAAAAERLATAFERIATAMEAKGQ